jgi:hypothetical protein
MLRSYSPVHGGAEGVKTIRVRKANLRKEHQTGTHFKIDA